MRPPRINWIAMPTEELEARLSEEFAMYGKEHGMYIDWDRPVLNPDGGANRQFWFVCKRNEGYRRLNFLRDTLVSSRRLAERKARERETAGGHGDSPKPEATRSRKNVKPLPQFPVLDEPISEVRVHALIAANYAIGKGLNAIALPEPTQDWAVIKKAVVDYVKPRMRRSDNRMSLYLELIKVTEMQDPEFGVIKKYGIDRCLNTYICGDELLPHRPLDYPTETRGSWV